MENSPANEGSIVYVLLFFCCLAYISYYFKKTDYSGREISFRDWRIVKELNVELRDGKYNKVFYAEIQKMVNESGLDNK